MKHLPTGLSLKLTACKHSIFALLLGASACAWAPPEQTISETEARRIESSLPTATTPPEPAHAVLHTAKSMLGINYRYGGHSPSTGFDCSGLVYYAHLENGIAIPRTAREQFSFAHRVDRQNLRPGDLLFFRTIGRRISHVGIYLAPGKFLHAPGKGKQVSVASYQTDYWRNRFAGAGRISR